MPHQQQHTLPALDEQLQAVIEQGWEHLVLPHLPVDYEEQASRLGAFVRQSQIKRVSDLLRAVLAYVLCAPSFRQLGSWAVLIGLANLSNVAWRKRLRKARAWLLWLLCEMLAVTPPPASTSSPSLPRILLIDATRLKAPGGSGDDWRVHLGYDLLAGQLVDVRVADRHTAEAFELFELLAGDLVIADRGYSRCRQLAYAVRQGAHVVVRLEVQKVPLLDEQEQPLDVVAWLRESQGGTQCRAVACAYQGQRFRGRLIACALPAEAAERARAKARRKASKQQRQLKEQTLFLAGWLLVFTSLPLEHWSDAQVLALYRARWQVELLIKRMKQVLKLAQLRGQTALTNEATILALLVCWALQQQEAASARALLQQGAQAVQGLTAPATAGAEAVSSPMPQELPEAAVSSWLLTCLCVQTLRVVVQGYWTPARLLACLPCLHRFVCGSPRQREHQETTIRRLLKAQVEQTPASPPLVFSWSSA